MAEGVRNPEREPAPPPGEPIHLPGPSYLPAVTALGVTIAVVGVVLSLVLAGIGVLITVVAVILWVRDVREDMSELPLEH
jgi:type IV secretory pathway TrbD component